MIKECCTNGVRIFGDFGVSLFFWMYTFDSAFLVPIIEPG